MRQVLIISGKGCTGKTSITAAMASMIGNIVVADCDVDAPDLHILLKPRIEESSVLIPGSRQPAKLCRFREFGTSK